jgi:hypothetical protein
MKTIKKAKEALSSVQKGCRDRLLDENDIDLVEKRYQAAVRLAKRAGVWPCRVVSTSTGGRVCNSYGSTAYATVVVRRSADSTYCRRNAHSIWSVFRGFADSGSHGAGPTEYITIDLPEKEGTAAETILRKKRFGGIMPRKLAGERKLQWCW